MGEQTWLQVGMNGRFFPGNWRPARQEIAFAQAAGFQTIQFAVRDEELRKEKLGDTFATVAALLAEARLTAVMEILVRIDEQGRTPNGLTPLDILEASLPAITALPCKMVHWHLAASRPLNTTAAEAEELLYPQLNAGVALARQSGFLLGLEHNEPDLLLFGTPAQCAAALAAAPGLNFVWDLNHTAAEHLAGFLDLAPRMSMLHVSDTALPEVNYHLPLGQGSIDFATYFAELRARGFTGPAILEIGGQPKSGGFGRDTDAALIDSRRRLTTILDTMHTQQR